MKPRTYLLETLLAARRRTQRGAAYVEAIIVIFFMIIIFVGVIYLGRYFEAQQRALGIARECAWLYSRQACTNKEALPPVCAGIFDNNGDSEKQPDPELSANVQQKQEEKTGSSNNAGGIEGIIRRAVEKVQGRLVELLVGEAITAHGQAPIEKPRLLPDAEGVIFVNYYLPCNLKHEDPLELAMEVFSNMVKGGD